MRWFLDALNRKAIKWMEETIFSCVRTNMPTPEGGCCSTGLAASALKSPSKNTRIKKFDQAVLFQYKIAVNLISTDVSIWRRGHFNTAAPLGIARDAVPNKSLASVCVCCWFSDCYLLADNCQARQWAKEKRWANNADNNDSSNLLMFRPYIGV